MDVQDGVGTSDATRVCYDLEQLHLRNTSHICPTGSHNGFERLDYNNCTDMSVVPGFVNGLIYSDMPEDDEMDTEVKRLSSFKNWPSSSPIKPKDLAAAGFYFVGRDDQVRCFRCDLTLRRWESCDVPWEEHKSKRPLCPFVREHEEREHHNITCQSVEVAGGSDPPKISFPGKEVYASQVRHFGPGVSSSSYPVSFSPLPTDPFCRQNMRYESSENSLESGYNYPNTSQLSYSGELQLERNKSIYNSEEYYVNKSAPQATASQIYPQEENNLPSSENAGLYFKERTIKHGQIHSVGATETPMFRYPNQGHSCYTMGSTGQEEYSFQKNTELELAKESYSYSLPPGRTVQVGEEEGGAKQVYVQKEPLDNTMQNKMKLNLQPPNRYSSSSNLKEQQQLPAKDPSQEMLMEKSSQYKFQGQVLPSSGMERFPSPNLQEVMSSTIQQRPWLSGHQTTRATGRVAPHPSISPGTPHQGYVHQGPLYRQENIRHGSSVAELQSEHHRLTTFVDWPQNSPINPCELAAAGFYYLGNGDNVKCYKCGCGLCNWDPNDTPWGEHLKWSPNCPLVIEHFQGRSAIDPVEGTEFTPEKVPQSSRAPYGGLLQLQQTQNAAALEYPQPKPSGQHHVRPHRIDQEISTNFSTAQNPYNRQNPSSEHVYTFASPVTVIHPSRKSCSKSLSPPATSQSPLKMAASSQPQSLCLTSQDIDHIVEMGFTRATVDEVISTQLANTGQTFTSVDELTNAVLEYGGTITLSSTANQTSATPTGMSPTVQSPIISGPVPTLRDITRESGATMVQTFNSNTHPAEQHREELRRTHSAPHTMESVPTGPESEEHESLEKKLERMQEERTCKICMDAEIGIVFLPCGHLVCCPNCASGVELCPMCRRPIQESVRTYMS